MVFVWGVCLFAKRFASFAVWAVHERPLRGVFSFLVGVVVVWRIRLGESVWPLVPCIPRSHRFACSRPLALKRRGRAGRRPALVGGPLCPSDISPVNGGTLTFCKGPPSGRGDLFVVGDGSSRGVRGFRKWWFSGWIGGVRGLLASAGIPRSCCLAVLGIAPLSRSETERRGEGEKVVASTFGCFCKCGLGSVEVDQRRVSLNLIAPVSGKEAK